MLIDFFYTLRAAKLKVSVKEYLTLLEAVRAGVVDQSVENFYYVARAALVKDEAHYDKFDRAFAAYFKGVEMLTDFTQDVPLEWLRKNLELELSPEEKAAIEKMGWDELMETLKKRFEEQKERHEGGNRMIGTGGTSPFGAYGYNPQGIRIGQDKGRNKSAVKVWDQRQYKDYDDSLELGTRNIKVALRRLRKWAREGAPTELDLPETIYRQFDETIERLWRDKQADVAYAYHSQLTRFRDALPEHRKPSYRIADLHTFSPEALELFLQPTIFSLISAIWGEPAVALQSLYFEWGSQQALHRDPERRFPSAAALAAELRHLGGLLGLLGHPASEWLAAPSTLSSGAPEAADVLSAAEIEARIARRIEARRLRNWAESDRIRDELAAAGILLEDGPAGTTWRRK